MQTIDGKNGSNDERKHKCLAYKLHMMMQLILHDTHDICQTHLKPQVLGKIHQLNLLSFFSTPPLKAYYLGIQE